MSKVHNLFGGLGWDRDGGRCKSTNSSHHTINEMGQTDQNCTVPSDGHRRDIMSKGFFLLFGHGRDSKNFVDFNQIFIEVNLVETSKV